MRWMAITHRQQTDALERYMERMQGVVVDVRNWRPKPGRRLVGAWRFETAPGRAPLYQRVVDFDAGLESLMRQGASTVCVVSSPLPHMPTPMLAPAYFLAARAALRTGGEFIPLAWWGERIEETDAVWMHTRTETESVFLERFLEPDWDAAFDVALGLTGDALSPDSVVYRVLEWYQDSHPYVARLLTRLQAETVASYLARLLTGEAVVPPAPMRDAMRRALAVAARQETETNWERAVWEAIAGALERAAL